MESIEVVAGVLCNELDNEGRFLIAQKPANHRLIPDKWEFPGGTLKEGESHQHGLHRELEEEFNGIKGIRVAEWLGTYEHSYDQIKNIVLHAYLCKIRGNPKPKEHQAIIWGYPDELLSYNLAFLDRQIAERLMGYKFN